MVRDRRETAAAAGRTGLIGLCALLLLGDLAWSLKERSVQELFKAALLQFSQDAIVLNILIGALPALFALSAGPVVGAWSDRTRTRYGRRVPFLLAASAICALGMLGLAFSHGVVGLAVSWTVFEMATIVGNVLLIALINDTVPQHILGRFFGLFRIVSLATGAGFFGLLFRNDLTTVLQPLLLGITAAYLAGMLVLCWRVREPDYGAPVRRPRWQVLQAGDGQWGWLFAALAVAAVAVLPININAFNARTQFGVDVASFGQAFALTYGISIVLAWPLGWLADRYHPLRVGGVALVLYALTMLVAWRLVDGPQSFLAALVVHGVLAGCFLTGTAALLPALLPRERFSQLAAVSAAVTSLLTIVSTLAMGALLDESGRDFHLLYLAGGLTAGLGVLLWALLLRRYPVIRTSGR